MRKATKVNSQTRIDQARAALGTARLLADEAANLAADEAAAATAAAVMFSQQAHDAKARQVEAESLI